MIDQLWLQLLRLIEQLDALTSPFDYCHLSIADLAINRTLPDNDSPSVLIYWLKPIIKQPQNTTGILLTPNQPAMLINPGELPEDAVDFLCLYLPYCLLSLQAKKEQKAQVVAHFAQTLDGKIATNIGASRWIGNQENLIHAHRMRALCDAVLIGKGTLLTDDPQLTVRHVKGKNPIRIVLGTHFQPFTCRMNTEDGPIWLLGKVCDNIPQGFHFHPMSTTNEHDLLKMLFTLGVKTIYLEGGPATTSRFLATANVKILQLHLSPMIFGSGISAIVLPEIHGLEERIQFKKSRFIPIGDAVMFIGYL